MKRKLATLIICFLVLGAIVLATAKAYKSTSDYELFLPLITTPGEYIIDCIDENGHFIPCPEEGD